MARYAASQADGPVVIESSYSPPDDVLPESVVLMISPAGDTVTLHDGDA